MSTTFYLNVATVQKWVPLRGTDENLQVTHQQHLLYLRDGIADSFLDATCNSAPRSNKCRDARLVYAIGYFDRTGLGGSPRRGLARRRESRRNVHWTGGAYKQGGLVRDGVDGLRIRRGRPSGGRPLSVALDRTGMRKKRVLEWVVEASLAAQRFGQEVGLRHIAVFSDEHSDGTTCVYYQHP